MEKAGMSKVRVDLTNLVARAQTSGEMFLIQDRHIDVGALVPVQLAKLAAEGLVAFGDWETFLGEVQELIRRQAGADSASRR